MIGPKVVVSTRPRVRVPRKAGLYDGLSDTLYHSDRRSLSSTGAKMLARTDSTPYEFWYAQNHPQPRKRAFDLGHATHRRILSAGAEIEPIEFDDYRKKDAQEQRDKAYDAGRIPLLPKEKAQVDAMTKRVYQHELAGALLTAPGGVAERSGWWFDDDTGVWCRFRPDWWVVINGVLYIVDIKTTAKPGIYEFEKSAGGFAYHQQDPWYVEGAAKLTGFEQISFLFVVVGVKPPHMVTVRYYDEDAVEDGARANRRARQIFARCRESGHWPEHPLGPIPMGLPKWHQFEDEESTDDDE